MTSFFTRLKGVSRASANSGPRFLAECQQVETSQKKDKHGLSSASCRKRALPAFVVLRGVMPWYRVASQIPQALTKNDSACNLGMRCGAPRIAQLCYTTSQIRPTTRDAKVYVNRNGDANLASTSKPELASRAGLQTSLLNIAQVHCHVPVLRRAQSKHSQTLGSSAATYDPPLPKRAKGISTLQTLRARRWVVVLLFSHYVRGKHAIQLPGSHPSEIAWVVPFRHRQLPIHATLGPRKEWPARSQRA